MTHEHLFAIAPRRDRDYHPYGFALRGQNNLDCSCGCRWWLHLVAMPYDWGVCANPNSHRCGLLTFEHQGCTKFQGKEKGLP